MIVLDESIAYPLLIKRIAVWYPGQVVPIESLRPKTLVKDEAIPMLLRRVTQPTFLTINIDDFWRKVHPQSTFCVIATVLRQEEYLLADGWLRRCLRMPEFQTKANRMGKVLLLRPSHIEYYEADRKIVELDWPT